MKTIEGFVLCALLAFAVYWLVIGALKLALKCAKGIAWITLFVLSTGAAGIDVGAWMAVIPLAFLGAKKAYRIGNKIRAIAEKKYRAHIYGR